MLSIKDIKVILFTRYSIYKYGLTLHRKSDSEINAIVSRERSCRGWTSQRSYFLAALRKECIRRRLEYCW